MPLRPDMLLEDYLQLFSKRKWTIIICFFLIFFCAVVYILVTPKQFKSTTTVLVIPQRVPSDFVLPTVTLGIEGRLSNIEQQITSSTRLKKVMEELRLFEKARKEGLEENAIKEMVSRIEIEVADDPNNKEWGRRIESEAFSLSFVHEDPTVAMLTTSRLVSMFIEENLQMRERQAVGTSEFLESQLKSTKAKLEAQEAKVKRYKLRYSGELPQELQINLNKLSMLQEQYRTNVERIRVTEQKKLTIQNMIRSDRRQILMTELASRRNQLAELSAKYTDQYPDVIRLREEVIQLERKLAEKPGIDMEGIDRMQAEITSAEAEIESLEREREKIRQNINTLQAKADQYPRREQEMISLTRDYDNLKKLYDDLLKRKTEANIAQDMEMRQKGDQFQILSPANLPTKPFKPKPRLVFGFAFLMAGFLGIGGAIGLEKIDLSLRGVTDFKYYFDLPILASVPILETVKIDRQKNNRRKAIVAGIISLALAFFVFLLFFKLKFQSP